jgi:hypothetical protein
MPHIAFDACSQQRRTQACVLHICSAQESSSDWLAETALAR